MTVRLAARRKLVYVTGTRADFGLMASTLLQASRVLDLGVAVTGMHLDVGCGHTVEEVRASGLAVVGEVAVDLRARSPRGMAASVWTMIVGLSELLERERGRDVRLAVVEPPGFQRPNGEDDQCKCQYSFHNQSPMRRARAVAARFRRARWTRA